MGILCEGRLSPSVLWMTLRCAPKCLEATAPPTSIAMKKAALALLFCSADAAWVQNPAVRFSGGATVPRRACDVAATATETEPAAVVEEKYEFEAEVSKVMDIIINSLYSDKVRPTRPTDRSWRASRLTTGVRGRTSSFVS